MPHFSVTAIGRDRPGIVAALSDALYDLEGNIEDSRMSILRGHFSVMLIVSTPASTGREEVDGRLQRTATELGLEAIAVSEVDELTPAEAESTHVLTVYGADHPGIVRAVSAALAEHGANVVDLSTQLGGGEGSPIYLLVIELELGAGAEGDLRSALEAVGREAAVEVNLRPLETSTL